MQCAQPQPGLPVPLGLFIPVSKNRFKKLLLFQLGTWTVPIPGWTILWGTFCTAGFLPVSTEPSMNTPACRALYTKGLKPLGPIGGVWNGQQNLQLQCISQKTNQILAFNLNRAFERSRLHCTEVRGAHREITGKNCRLIWSRSKRLRPAGWFLPGISTWSQPALLMGGVYMSCATNLLCNWTRLVVHGPILGPGPTHLTTESLGVFFL
jgi:hypothetical protein